MNTPDIILHTLQYFPYDAKLFANLSLVSKQWKELVETDEQWKNIFFKKYPMARTILTHNFKRACIEMAWYKKHGKKVPKQDLKLIVLGANGCGKSALTIRFASGYFLDHYFDLM